MIWNCLELLGGKKLGIHVRMKMIWMLAINTYSVIKYAEISFYIKKLYELSLVI